VPRRTSRPLLGVHTHIQAELGHNNAHGGQRFVHGETPFSKECMLHYQQRRGAGLRVADRPCPFKFIPCRMRAVEDFRYRSIFDRSNEKAIASTSQAQGLGAGTDSSLLVSASRSLLVYLISSLIIQGTLASPWQEGAGTHGSRTRATQASPPRPTLPPPLGYEVASGGMLHTTYPCRVGTLASLIVGGVMLGEGAHGAGRGRFRGDVTHYLLLKAGAEIRKASDISSVY